MEILLAILIIFLSGVAFNLASSISSDHALRKERAAKEAADRKEIEDMAREIRNRRLTRGSWEE